MTPAYRPAAADARGHMSQRDDAGPKPGSEGSRPAGNRAGGRVPRRRPPGSGGSAAGTEIRRRRGRRRSRRALRGAAPAARLLVRSARHGSRGAQGEQGHRQDDGRRRSVPAHARVPRGPRSGRGHPRHVGFYGQQLPKVRRIAAQRLFEAVAERLVPDEQKFDESLAILSGTSWDVVDKDACREERNKLFPLLLGVEPPKAVPKATGERRTRKERSTGTRSRAGHAWVKFRVERSGGGTAVWRGNDKLQRGELLELWPESGKKEVGLAVLHFGVCVQQRVTPLRRPQASLGAYSKTLRDAAPRSSGPLSSF